MNISLSGRSLRAARGSVLVLAAAFGAAGLALAVNPSLKAEVVEIPATVTLSTNQYPTYAAYQVTVTSYRPNAVAGVRFVGTTGSGATLAGKIGEVTCIDGAPTRTFDCQIGPLPGAGGDPLGTKKVFTVILNAPSAGSVISLTWDVFFDESGAGGADAGQGTATTALNTTRTNSIDSYIPPGGSTFGTGNGFAIGTTNPATNNPSTTTVKVPSSASASIAATTAKIEETDLLEGCVLPNLMPQCFKSTITLLDGSYSAAGTTLENFTGLVITLWRDVLYVKPGSKAEDYPVYYEGSPTGLLLCSQTVGGLPTSGIPCIFERRIISRKYQQDNGLPAAAIGDLRAIVWATDNGVFNY